MPARRSPNKVLLDVRHRAGKSHALSLVRLARRFLKTLSLEGCELSLSLVDDREIRTLNRDWRKKDKATDVLSFPAPELPPGVPGRRPLGDVVISLDTAKRQAREEGRTLPTELARYLAHGILHLLGHDHHRRADAEKMASEEERLLGQSGMVPRPVARKSSARAPRSV